MRRIQKPFGSYSAFLEDQLANNTTPNHEGNIDYDPTNQSPNFEDYRDYDPTDQYPLGHYMGPIHEVRDDNGNLIGSMQEYNRTNKSLADLEEARRTRELKEAIRKKDERDFEEEKRVAAAYGGWNGKDSWRRHQMKPIMESEAEASALGAVAPSLSPYDYLIGAGGGVASAELGRYGINKLAKAQANREIQRLYNHIDATKMLGWEPSAGPSFSADMRNLGNNVKDSLYGAYKGFMGSQAMRSAAAATPYMVMAAPFAAALETKDRNYDRYKNGQMGAIYDEMMSRPED